MAEIDVWYHDPAEVDPLTSWTGLPVTLANARYGNYNACTDSAITRLFQYARPDAVIAVDKKPILVIEQTTMNPSGHNIPQRFSCIEKAAENGVPCIYYYTERAKRIFSDPGPRNLNVRIPLAQFMLMTVWESISLSVFWPTHNWLPVRSVTAHRRLAQVIDELVSFVLTSGRLPTTNDLDSLPRSSYCADEMDRAIEAYGRPQGYPRQVEFVALFPKGVPGAQRRAATPIDPPHAARLHVTAPYLSALQSKFRRRARHWVPERNNLASREHSLVFTGAPNRRTMADSEHPYAGHLVMLDILYCRLPGARRRIDRRFNLIYQLPEVSLDAFLNSMHIGSTPAHITINNADLVVLDDGIITGDSSSRPQQVMLHMA